VPEPTRTLGGLQPPDLPPPDGSGARPAPANQATGRVPAIGWLIGGAVAAIVFAPYLTLAMPHSKAMTVQAALILLATTVLAAAGLARSGSARRIRGAPRAVRIGIAAYSGAVLLGAVVGLARGNGHAFLAGQVVSMGLLPFGAVAGLAIGRAPFWRMYAGALAACVAVASCINIACWLLGIAGGTAWNRMFLVNNVSPAPAALITLNLTLAALVSRSRPVRWAGGVSFLATGMLVVGSGIRSLWLVLVPSLLAVLVASTALRRLAPGAKRIRTTLGAAAGATLVLAAWVLLRPTSDPARALAARVEREAAVLAGRAAYLVPRGSGRSFMDDPSFAYRALEMKVLVQAFTEGTPVTKVFGRGLGYAYLSTVIGLDREGAASAWHPTNYVHNFYLFLPVKLGIVGGAGVLGALVLWVAWTVRAARGCRREPQRTFLIAASAVWIAAAAWNLACPEFIDFRLAALWGLLIAACVNAADDSSRDDVGGVSCSRGAAGSGAGPRPEPPAHPRAAPAPRPAACATGRA
jgi:hypothetical protein